jgi:hypothetical protein
LFYLGPFTKDVFGVKSDNPMEKILKLPFNAVTKHPKHFTEKLSTMFSETKQ